VILEKVKKVHHRLAGILFVSGHGFKDKITERMDTPKNKADFLEAMEEAVCEI